MPNRQTTRLAAYCMGLMLTAGMAWGQGGGVNVEKYVALGDSLTAAFSSGGLSIEQQADSYSALLHRAFQAVGGPGERFEQPLVSEPGLPAQLSLQGLFPTVIAPSSDNPGQLLNLGLQRPYDNLGVPGARMHDPANTVSGGAHDLILRGSGFTVLQQALSLRPSIVTLQIGNNDVLGAATRGLVDPSALTPAESFEADLRALVGALAASEAQLAIANLPDVTTIPFFTTIPPVVFDPNTGVPVLVNGELVPLIGPEGPLGLNDLVLLTASVPLDQGIGIPTFIPGGTGKPLPNDVVLNAAETSQIQNRVTVLNDVIATVAEEHGAALVDVKGLFGDIVANGLTLGGIDFSADFLTGGLFSYDGVHPTRLGYGVLANAFIDAINRTFGAAVPPVDLERLAFEPPICDPEVLICPAGSGPATFAEGSRWTPFVYSREAWQNLQFALGIDAFDTATPRPPGPPTLPDRPDPIRRQLTSQQASPGRASVVRPHAARQRTPTTQPERLSRQSP